MSFLKKNKSSIIFFTFLLLALFALFRFTGAFVKGYNIVEDHALVDTNNEIDSVSITGAYEKMMELDVSGFKRFRPVWAMYIVGMVAFLSVDLLLISLFVFLIFVFTSFFLYRFCVNIGFSTLQAAAFAILTILGPQTVLWIRLIDAEIIGMFFLSMSLYFLSKAVTSYTGTKVYKSFFIISIVFTGLCKESFLLFVPAIIIVYILSYSRIHSKKLIQSLKENMLIVVLSVVYTIAVLVILISLVGTNQHRYAGVEAGLFGGKTILDFYDIVLSENLFILALIGIFFVIESELQYFTLSSDHMKERLKEVSLVFLLMLVAVVPQFILYYKTGFVERYYLPYLLGFTFVFVFVFRALLESSYVHKIVKYLYSLAVLAFVVIVLLSKVIPSYTTFSNSCSNTMNAIRTIEDSKVKELLVVLDPVTQSHFGASLKSYLDYLGLNLKYKYDFAYVEKRGKFADSSSVNLYTRYSRWKYEKSLIDSTKGDSSIRCVLLFHNIEDYFLKKNSSWFDQSKYARRKIGWNYVLYIKE